MAKGALIGSSINIVATCATCADGGGGTTRAVGQVCGAGDATVGNGVKGGT